jgi:hypothetical protein
MFLTIEKPGGMRLVLDVSRICYLGPDVDADMRFCDFVVDATIRNATEEETLYFAPPSEEAQ